MINFLRRDERQERYATERTQKFRAMLDRAGIRWGLGVYPNVETEYFAASSIGPVTVNVTTTKDETIVVIYNQYSRSTSTRTLGFLAAQTLT